MGDFLYSDNEEDYYISDCDSADGLDNDDAEDDDNDLQWMSGASSTKVITRESLLVAQREDLRRVMEMLNLSEQHARTLLIYHRWDVEKVFAVFVEKGKDKLFGEAGVTEKSCKIKHAPAAMTCEVCMEDIPEHKATTMDCGHCFCNNCWTEHFVVKINEGKSRRITCMAYKCTAICDEAIVRNLVSARDPDLAERFERFLLESYIEDNQRVKWCPSVPHCGNAIRVEDEKLCEVECTCGVQFCFSCSSEAHSPCSCLMWELWVKKCRDESETVNWITVNTKSCPKCYKSVEKNGGCNLVSCICGQSFCWLCGGATGREHTWTSIAGHSCGRFKEDQEKQAERAKRDLNRYMHYHNRYKAHTDSFKLESKLKETIESQIYMLEGKESELKDFSWLTNGLNRLFRSRRVLSYSYPFAFYMFGEDLFGDEMTPVEREIKQNLFEDQQQQLEENVEKLSKALEEKYDGLEDDNLKQSRMQLINLSVITDRLCKSMYECIENDLLGSLKVATHNIAAYKSKGVERASELLVRATKGNNSISYLQTNSSISATGATVEQAKRAVSELKNPTINGKQFGVAPSQDSDTLFVGNICKTWTKEALKEKLIHYGVDNFEDLTLVEDTRNEGMNRGFAFLDFGSRPDALDACKHLQKRDVLFGTDRPAKIAFADTFIEMDDEVMAQVRAVFLDGLPISWDEDRVKDHLKKFGKIEKVELARNMPAAKRKDFGFVTFDSHDAAVACVEGVNNTELGDGDKKVKVRVRLSRPRQRGKSVKHGQGGYVERGGARGGRPFWNPSLHRTESRFAARSGRGFQSYSSYGGDYKRFGPRDRYADMDISRDRVGSRRGYPSSERSYDPRPSASSSYGRSTTKRDYVRREDTFHRSSDYVTRGPAERPSSFRDTYSSHGSGYADSSMRTSSRAHRRPEPLYADESYERYAERPSSYRGGHSREYSSISGSKRPHSATEEIDSRYAESTLRQPRARYEYEAATASLPYGDSAYESESVRLGHGSHLGYERSSRSSAGYSRDLYETRPSSMGYVRDEVSRGDAGGFQPSYGSREYMSTGSDVGPSSYSSMYPSRRANDGYSSGRGSGSYY